MDRRQRKTREAIFAAFTGLLEQKPYASITVQEILERADVGRSTFYAHFETKDALIVALCSEIADHVFSGDPAGEATHDFSGAGKDVVALITHILYHIQESRPYLVGLLKSSSGELFMAELRHRVAQELAAELSAGIEGVPADYLANHVACDFAETVRWWMAHPDYSPEQICAFFLATTRL
ncbi:MAG: TetR/AcrR family transcriptional regulator [Coriobacteriales bacterium]|nr:TetR/AcrR family transcriptional regulator [Coriobacteriales bacterium]